MNPLKVLAAKSIIHQKIQRRTGGTCDYYIDSAQLLFNPQLLSLAAEQMLNIAYNHDVTHIGGEATSALPLVGAIMTLSELKGSPLNGFMIRKEKKTYGTSNLIEGAIPKGSRVLLVDDVTGRGSAAKRCCKLLIDQGIPIVGYVSIVDRNETARDELNKLGVDLIPLFQIHEIMERSL
ncbi:phosphoribosyltransferase family protein [Bacillus toyonensis]|uniref:orotate phosphoribosyltransferase n=1 Tax=Bacillus toyonensis TaxID=155322 RepID=UPI003D1962AF